MTDGVGSSRWSRLASLPLVVEGYELERLEVGEPSGYERVSSHVRLLGDGTDGLGEDVSPFADEHDAFLGAGPSLPLAGHWTLARFCDHLATLDQWPAPPKWEQERRYRNWAFESAALDLALRQAGRALHDVLELEARPVRFVNSLGLGDPPSIDTIQRRIARYPGLRLKLDAVPAWTPELMAELAATGAVDTIDFKGQYGLPVDDVDALPGMYEHVLESFPDALLEDPHSLPAISALLTRSLARVSYDAPIHEAADIGATPLSARIVNVKPSRIGALRPLLGIYDHCAARGLRMYGGGMGELGVGRSQIQLLASLFHADAPNDVAPSAYNETDPPDGLPPSPLTRSSQPAGFR
jgi:L-alanine-DL-glutamate epimerase-like enolase superfamily enzyme